MVNSGAAPANKTTQNGVGTKRSPTYRHVGEGDAEHQFLTMSAGELWMRYVSFAGLHRILSELASHDGALRPIEINRRILKKRIVLTKGQSPPSLTTLYHYRNTLLRLNALVRIDDGLVVNRSDPDVHKLVNQSPPDGNVLDNDALDPFASLVLRNQECHKAFFELFLPKRTPDVKIFRENGMPVSWYRDPDPHVGVVFNSQKTSHLIKYNTPSSAAATLYGIRYWARDELKLIDEYPKNCGKGDVVMFTIRKTPIGSDPYAVRSMACLIVNAISTKEDWTVFKISNLIEKYCLEKHLPIVLLHQAIKWLIQRFPGHVVPIKTSRAMATLASPAHLQTIHLKKRYLREVTGGPYISDIRIHKDIPHLEDTCRDQ